MDITEEALQYDLESLRKNVEKCKANIAIFEEAIGKEYATINRLRAMIAVLEDRQRAESGKHGNLRV